MTHKVPPVPPVRKAKPEIIMAPLTWSLVCNPLKSLSSWEVFDGKRWSPMGYITGRAFPHKLVCQLHDELIFEELDPVRHSQGCSKPRFKVRQCL